MNGLLLLFGFLYHSNIFSPIHAFVCLTIVILNTFLSQQFPYPKYTENFFIATVEGLLPLLMTLAFMYSAMSVIKVSDIVTNYT